MKRRMIDADKLLERLSQPGFLSVGALSCVRYSIEQALREHRKEETWRNPGWQEREKESK